MDKSKVIILKTFDTEAEASMVKGLLDSAGISSSLLNADIQSVLPLQNFAQIKLAVAAADAEDARKIIAAKFDKEDFAEQTGTTRRKSSRCGCKK